MEIEGDRLFVQVDDTNARYPLMIDPFIQTDKLTASDGAAGGQFGRSVSVSGDTVVVGAFLADIGLNADQGSAYIFSFLASISTLSQWGMIGFTGLLLLSSIAFIKRRRG